MSAVLPSVPDRSLADHALRASHEPALIAVSPAMCRAVELARRFAPLDLPILLVGATGTGKEVLAQAIHRWSARSGPLVDVDCGALPAGMAVSELFGHRRGAFTTAVESMPGLLEEANGGTLFLDELASLPLDGQASLLRVLETGHLRRVGQRTKQRVDFRLIAAAQETVGELRRDRRLREDLYQRLAGAVIQLPSLCDRPEDVLALARHYVAAFKRQMSDSAGAILLQYGWPGNVRELRHVISRAATLSDSTVLESAAICEALDLGADASESRATQASQRLAADRLRLEELLELHGGSPEVVAAELGISRATVYRRLKRVGLTVSRRATGESGADRRPGRMQAS